MGLFCHFCEARRAGAVDGTARLLEHRQQNQAYHQHDEASRRRGGK